MSVAEWPALRTAKRDDSCSIPAKVKNFYRRNQVSNNTLHVVLNLINFFLI